MNHTIYSTVIHRKAYILVLFTFLLTAGCATQSTQPQVTLNDGSWQLKVDRYGHSVAAVGDKIFVFGGSSWGGRIANEIEIIDVSNKTSQVKRVNIIPRRYARAVSDGKRYIYLVGGIYLGKTVALVPFIEKFDSKTFKVERIANLPTLRRNPAVVLLDEKIYIAGGRKLPQEGHKGYTQDLEIYDLANGNWHKGADMPEAVGSKAVVANGNIYVAGGYNGKVASNNLMEYSPTLDQWNSVAKIPEKVSANSLVSFNNRLFILGDYSNVNSSYSYDLISGAWQTNVFDLKPARHSDALVLDNHIFLIGGNVAAKDSVLGNIQVLDPTQKE